MKQIGILLILGLGMGTALGQTDLEWTIQLALAARTTADIEKINTGYKIVNTTTDSLRYNLVQHNYQLVRKKRVQQTGLLTLSVDTEIVYSEVHTWYWNEEFTDIAHQILEAWKKDDWNPDSFDPAHLMRPPGRSIFGYACYASGSLPAEGLLMMDLVKEQNTQELTNWLVSINPVRQAYAYLGFALMEAKGFQIDSDTKAQMSELQSSDFPIYYCSGCTIQDFIPLSDVLSADKVERFINRFRYE